nr:serine hydrolase domain-containing protein [uncultured Rhodoferax sp.]
MKPAWLWVALWAAGLPWAMADTQPLCDTAGAYQGGALHAPLPAHYFPILVERTASLPSLPAELAARLDQRLHALLRQTGAPAISAAMEVPGLGRWVFSQGMARTQPPEAADADTLFYWGSIAKSITAVLVLQLVQEGKLSLDDRLARWFPHMPHAAHITIDQLLSHRSGLATNAGDPLDAFASQTAQLHQAANTPSLFCPGADASYSNTGYLLLGLVVEAVEQQPYHAIVHQRIAGPLGLRHLRALRPDETNTPGLVSPHQGRVPQPDPAAWQRLGNGNVVATAADMGRFWRALLTGQLLPPATVQRQWAELYPLRNIPPNAQAGSWFGQGVMLTEMAMPSGERQVWLNHLGGTPTANAVVLYAPESSAFVAVAVNNAVSAPAVANALLKVLADWR